MEFSPFNPIVKLCIQGINFEENGEAEEAAKVFIQAWHEAGNDFEKFLTAYFVARHQPEVSGQLQWYQTALQHALTIDDDSVKSAYPALYFKIAKCYADLGDPENAKLNESSGNSFTGKPTDAGPFYHGTKADVRIGDFLTPGFGSNYEAELIMNHVYFTAMQNGAGLAAALSKGDGRERVYIIEPTGDFEHDPNVTDKKFPGNLTRSYRTTAPLKVIGEIPDWVNQLPGEIKKWHERLANNKGDIIN